MNIHRRIEASPNAKDELFAALERSGRSELSDLMLRLDELIANSELEERERKQLEKLKRAVEDASLRYLEAVVEHFAANDRQTHLSDRQAAEVVAEKSLARTRAHNALIDSVRIYLRNAENFGVEGADQFRRFWVDPNDDGKRTWLGRQALTMAFNSMAESIFSGE